MTLKMRSRRPFGIGQESYRLDSAGHWDLGSTRWLPHALRELELLRDVALMRGRPQPCQRHNVSDEEAWADFRPVFDEEPEPLAPQVSRRSCSVSSKERRICRLPASLGWSRGSMSSVDCGRESAEASA